MTNKLKLLSSSFIMALILAAPFSTYAMEPGEDYQFEEEHRSAHAPALEPEDDQKVEHASRPFNIHTYMTLALKLPQSVMDAIYHSTPQLAEYPSFLNGKLIYKPNKENDEGMVVLPIADLRKPLEGAFDLFKRGAEFDLSGCGAASKYLSINIGCRKGKRPENEGKLEIWFALHSWIEENLQELPHFKGIMVDQRPGWGMGSWDRRKAPVGTFFTWGNWDNLGWYEFDISRTWESYNDPEYNLRESHTRSRVSQAHAPYELMHDCFYLIFDELEKFQANNPRCRMAPSFQR